MGFVLYHMHMCIGKVGAGDAKEKVKGVGGGDRNDPLTTTWSLRTKGLTRHKDTRGRPAKTLPKNHRRACW